MTDLQLPETFGRFQLLKLLQQDEEGALYQARLNGVAGFTKPIALKRLNASAIGNQSIAQEFSDYAKRLASLTHRHIPQVIELGQIDDRHFIAMEYVEGKSMAEVVQYFRRHNSNMPIPFALNVALAVCNAVNHAHGKHIHHGSLSDSNILLSYEGAVKVVGLGKSDLKVASEQQQALYADIISIGELLYQWLTGVKADRKNNPPTAPSKLEPTIPKVLDGLILKTLSLAQDDGWQTIGEVQTELERFVQQSRLTFGANQLSQWLKSSFAEDHRRSKVNTLANQQQMPHRGMDKLATLFEADDSEENDPTIVDPLGSPALLMAQLPKTAKPQDTDAPRDDLSVADLMSSLSNGEQDKDEETVSQSISDIADLATATDQSEQAGGGQQPADKNIDPGPEASSSNLEPTDSHPTVSDRPQINTPLQQDTELSDMFRIPTRPGDSREESKIFSINDPSQTATIAYEKKRNLPSPTDEVPTVDMVVKAPSLPKQVASKSFDSVNDSTMWSMHRNKILTGIGLVVVLSLFRWICSVSSESDPSIDAATAIVQNPTKSIDKPANMPQTSKAAVKTKTFPQKQSRVTNVTKKKRRKARPKPKKLKVATQKPNIPEADSPSTDSTIIHDVSVNSDAGIDDAEAGKQTDQTPKDASTTLNSNGPKNKGDKKDYQKKKNSFNRKRAIRKSSNKPRKRRKSSGGVVSQSGSSKNGAKQTGEKSDGFLMITSRPYAKVFVDGRATGRSTPITPDKPLRLSPGKHVVVLKVNKQRFTFPVTIRSNEIHRLVQILPVQ